MSRRNKAEAGRKIQTADTIKPRTVEDAFSNPSFGLGFGSMSPVQGTQYPLTRMTQNYALINSLYRTNWVVQNVVNTVPEDMCREWFKVKGVGPEHMESLGRLQTKTRLRQRILEGLEWGRLYGGAIGVILIKGQDGILDTPLDPGSIMPGSFAGLYILDRWTGCYPDMGLVSDMSDPDFGLPKFYNITGPELNIVARVHHSRVIRFIGRELPYIERIAEMWWGESEIEALYHDLTEHDNVKANMAALTFRANVDTMEMQNLDQILSVGNSEMQRRFWNAMSAQNILRSNYGTRVINKGDALHNTQYNFTGLEGVYNSMCLALCGASHIPATKLFGRAPAGLNATGDGDLKNYYDYIDTQRESKLRPVLEKLLPVMAMSCWGQAPDDLEVTFPPLWTPTAREIADITKLKAEAIVSTFQSGLLDADTAQKELKALAEETGMFGSITDAEMERGAGKSYRDLTALRDPLSGLSFGDDL